MEEIELTILIPCLNEEKTVGTCVRKAKKLLEDNGIIGEVLVADNGSTDNSSNIAMQLGARVEKIEKRGYGAALIGGTKKAKGKYIIMADADDSYNLLEVLPLYEKLQAGYDLVIGNRYGGKMEKGAMKFLHKYIGTPIISMLARKKYKISIKDFNCGLRGYVKEKIEKLDCKCEGMEYASEMIIKAKERGLKMTEVPINFYRDGREGKSHLRTVEDGIRHFKVIFQ